MKEGTLLVRQLIQLFDWQKTVVRMTHRREAVGPDLNNRIREQRQIAERARENWTLRESLLTHYRISEEGLRLVAAELDINLEDPAKPNLEAYEALIVELQDLHENGYLQTYVLELILEEGKVSA